MLVLVLGVVVVAITGGEDNPPRTPIASPALGGALSPSSDGLPDQAVPQSAPEGIDWELYEGVALPYSDAAGPSVIDGPVARGFARSPVGALLAAEHIGYRHFIGAGDGWRTVTALQVLPGPGRDAYIEARTTVNGTPPRGGFGQTAAFRFITYSPDVAVIQFVSRFPASGNLQLVTTTVRWSDGDWRLELQPDGSESPSAHQITNLAAFAPWSGI